MRGAEIVAKAREFLGVRYRHQGRSREGLDCIGLPVRVRSELGLSNLDAGAYSAKATDTEMLDFCRTYLREVARTVIQPGDILVQMNGAVRHMAIVGDYPIGGLSVIHAWLPSKKVSEARLDDAFMADVCGCFRFPEVVDEQ